MRRVMALLMAFLVLAVLYAPVVLGAETRTVTGFLRIDHDAEFEPNFTFNLTDPASLDLLNWNQTVEGFQNDSGIIGAFTGPFLPPIEVLGAVNNYDVETLTVCGKVRFKTEWVMSGSSESWWRVPERGPYYGDNVNLTVWRVGSPDLLNFTDAMVPNNASHPNLVFNYSYDLINDTMNETFRWYNTTAWNNTFNSTWVRVVAPIHGDDFYAVRWMVTNRTVRAQHWLRFSQNDIGDDRDFKTWAFYPGGTVDLVGADLDFSVLHTVGHGYSVWGTEIEQGEGEEGPGETWKYMPTNFDDMTDSLTPTGTGDGGIWDGDWGNTGSVNLALEGVDVIEGSYSISATNIASNNQVFYLLDTGFDVTDYDTLTFSYKPKTTSVVSFQLWIYLPDSGGYRYKALGPFVQNSWNTVEVPLWAGFSSGGSPDYTDLLKIMFYFNSATSGQSCLIDKMFFTDDDADEPGGGGGAAPTLRWNTTLEDPITDGDYLTVLVPFLTTVENDTNVHIEFGTPNGSWVSEFWVAEHGPTDFGIKSVEWEEDWDTSDIQINMTIYNVTRRLWVVDRNTLNDPDLTWTYNHYNVEAHAWAPGDYGFGGIPYHVLQITDGAWENAGAPVAFFLGGRGVWDMRKTPVNCQHSDDWYVELWLTGYEGIARGTAAFSFALTGQWGKASDVLNPRIPFPTDPVWFYGMYLFPAIIAASDWVVDVLGGLGERIWSALVWIYEGIQWVVANAPWVIAGTLMIITFFVTLPVWARFYRLLQGLIRFGWTIADKGLGAGAEFANTFWTEYVSTSYAKKAIGMIRKVR